MLLLKQIRRKCFIETLKIISPIRRGLRLLGVVPQSSQFQENLGRLLLSLVWLVIMLVWTIVTCISSLWLLIVLILTKLVELLQNIAKQVLNVLYTLCRWAVGVKNTISTSKKSQTSVWKKDGASHPDYTSVSSATPGAPDTSLERAMKAPIDLDKL